MKYSLLSLLSFLSLAATQDLATALQGYPEASQFTTTLSDLTGDLNRTKNQKYTILVPTNQAFKDFAAKFGQAISSFPQDQRRSYLRYHVLVGALTSANFSSSKGLTVPTLLKDSKYNNRTAGSALIDKYGAQATGQVLFIAKDLSTRAPNKFRVKRQTNPGGIQVRGGLAENATLTAIDGTWSGGNFQIVNQILEPPEPCSNTIRSNTELLSLDNALNRSGIYPVLDTAKNVTCLAPNTAAFTKAGNPDKSLSQTDLIVALTFHTLPQPIYSEFITDGLTFKSLANLTVRVTQNSSGTWFNDAKLIQQNILTNNGLIHVLDKIMSPIAGEQFPTGANSSTNNGGSSTSKPSAANGMNSLLNYQFFIIGFIVAIFL